MRPPQIPAVHPRPLAAAALLLALLAFAVPAAAYETRHVVIVVIDGARWTEGLGDPSHTWHPRQALTLAPLGTTVATFLNDGATLTNPGHAAVLTGTWQPIANDGTERPHAPTAFEHWREATGEPASKTWLFSEKTKLSAVAWSDAPGFGAAFGASRDLGRVGDAAVMNAAIARLIGDRPSLMMVNLADVDIRGHANDWDGYLTALRAADSLVYVLWTRIQDDPALADRTTLFVTNDHGRHDAAHGGFANHGDGCAGCRRIQLLALGPDFKRGHVSLATARQIDILPTVAELLSFPVPGSQGTAMLDLFEHPAVDAGPAFGVARVALSAPVPIPSSGPVRLMLRAEPGERVEVDVIDAHGRLVAPLLRAPGSPSPIALTWDGRTGDGRETPAGVYFVRARRGHAAAVRRVVRVR